MWVFMLMFEENIPWVSSCVIIYGEMWQDDSRTYFLPNIFWDYS